MKKNNKSKLNKWKSNLNNKLYFFTSILILIILFVVVIYFTKQPITAGKAWSVLYKGEEGTFPLTITFTKDDSGVLTKEAIFLDETTEFIFSIGGIVNNKVQIVSVVPKVEDGGGVCGDSICGDLEDMTNCAVDCTPPPVCGDSICEAKKGEDIHTCLQDCKVGSCGDSVCGIGETLSSCPADCPQSCFNDNECSDQPVKICHPTLNKCVLCNPNAQDKSKECSITKDDLQVGFAVCTQDNTCVLCDDTHTCPEDYYCGLVTKENLPENAPSDVNLCQQIVCDSDGLCEIEIGEEINNCPQDCIKSDLDIYSVTFTDTGESIIVNIAIQNKGTETSQTVVSGGSFTANNNNNEQFSILFDLEQFAVDETSYITLTMDTQYESFKSGFNWNINLNFNDKDNTNNLEEGTYAVTPELELNKLFEPSDSWGEWKTYESSMETCYPSLDNEYNNEYINNPFIPASLTYNNNVVVYDYVTPSLPTVVGERYCTLDNNIITSSYYCPNDVYTITESNNNLAACSCTVNEQCGMGWSCKDNKCEIATGNYDLYIDEVYMNIKMIDGTTLKYVDLCIGNNGEDTLNLPFEVAVESYDTDDTSLFDSDTQTDSILFLVPISFKPTEVICIGKYFGSIEINEDILNKGEVPLKIILDPNNKITETNEDNNEVKEVFLI